MNRLAVALLMAGCSTGPSVIDVDLQIASGQQPLAEADDVALSVDDSAGSPLAVLHSAPAALQLALAPVPKGSGYVVNLVGTFAGDEIARGVSCPFDVGAAVPTVSVYLGDVGRFAPTGAPASTRTDAVALPYLGGALLAGGDSGGGALDTTEIYAEQSAAFTVGPSLGAAREGGVWAPLGDGSPLVIGGTQQFPSVETLTAGKWTAVPTLVPIGLVGLAATALGDGSVLACGGTVIGGPPLDSAWLIGTDTALESPSNAMVVARARHTLTSAGDGRNAAVFIVGGLGAAGPVAATEIFDPVTNSFAELGVDLSVARYAHSATLLKSGRLLVAGGLDESGTPLGSAELLDPVARRFLSVGPLATARSGHSATLLSSGRVLLTGGTDASGMPTASAEIFDPALGENGGFVATQPLNVPRSGHSAVPLCDGTILLVGGGAGAERYVPLP